MRSIVCLSFALSFVACGEVDKSTATSSSLLSSIVSFEGSYAQKGATCSAGKVEDRVAPALRQEQASLDAGKTQTLKISQKTMEIQSSADFFGSETQGCKITDRYVLQSAPTESPATSSAAKTTTPTPTTTAASLKVIASLDQKLCSASCLVDECVPVAQPQSDLEKSKRPLSTWTFSAKEGLLQTQILTTPASCRNNGIATPMLRTWKKN